MSFYLHSRTKYVNHLLFGSAVLIFAYTTLRAVVLSITWDEAFSYLQFVRHHILIPQKFESMDANNHLLNTWLDIQLTKVFGVNELVLRLPSLMAHFLFLLYSYKYVKTLENKWISLAAFLVVNLNPYLLDFFSLSRGYGLSLGLMMVSVYYLYVFVVDDGGKKAAVWSLLTAVLAVFANFVLLNYLLVLVAALLMVYIQKSLVLEQQSVKLKLFVFLKNSWLLIAIFFITMVLVLPIVFKLKEAQALYFGGTNGVWQDTISTLVNRSFYELDYGYWLQRFVKFFIVLVLSGTFLFLAVKEYQGRFSKQCSFLLILIAMIVLCGFINSAQHHLFGTPYLMERTALLFIPLFNILLVGLFNELFKSDERFVLILYWVCIFTCLHFVRSVNFKYVLEWKTNWCAKQMVKDLDALKVIPENKNSISICSPLAFMQSVNFYRAVENKVWINTVNATKEIDLTNDYLLLESEQLKGLNPNNIDVLKRYPLTNAVLVKSKLKNGKVKLMHQEIQNFETTTEKYFVMLPDMEYGPSIVLAIPDSLLGHKAEVVFKARILSPADDVLYTSVVCSFENKGGSYLWRRAFVKDYITKANEWTDIYFTCNVPKESKPNDIQKFYFWNPNKRLLHIESLEYKWLSYE